MLQTTKYVADDGTEFYERADCLAYEDTCREIAKIMSRLKPCDIRGTGFVQQEGPTFLSVQHDLVVIFERKHKDHHTEWARNATRNAGMSLIGRYIDDSGSKPMRHAWHRIMCTDHQFREYEQPYYAIQADKALHGE